MKTKENKSKELVKITESDLLSLVSEKLKNRVLFPDKVEKIKEHLKGAKFAK
jgi:hypothetical protein